MIKGISVTLYQRSEGQPDRFGVSAIIETPVSVADVIVAPVGGQEAVDTMNLYGRTATYKLGIPKGDAHTWDNCRVEFFGQSFRVFGKPTEGISDMIPLRWNKQVLVETINAND